jgi:hypothetical protein
METAEAIAILEKEYPNLAQSFKDIQTEEYGVFAKKHLSYGMHNISVGTELRTPAEVHASLTGIWFRSNDKIQRLKKLVVLAERNSLEEEPTEDSYVDLSNYSTIALMVKRGVWKK